MTKQTDTKENNQILKRFTVTTITLALIVAGLLYYIYTSETGKILHEIETNETHSIKFRAATVSSKFRQIISDLRFIAPHHELKNYLDSGNKDAMHHLELDLTALSKSKQSYDQIRFIDIKGMEKLRINFNEGSPSATPDHQLQNKSNRYYFKETIALNDKDIYISPLDLNIEHGEIELPYKPMIRFGAPIFDSQANLKGAVIINYLAQIMLNEFNVSKYITLGTPMLLNSDSYWLLSSDPAKQWGFMFDKDITFKKESPSEWTRINSSDSGQFYSSGGLLTFTTIYPLRELISPDTDPIGTIHSGVKQLAQDIYYWKAISLVPASVISDKLAGQMITLIQVYIILMIVLSFISWQLAQMTVQRKHAFDSLRRALGEKDMLMREINHRAKNNLNIIQGLLSLKSAILKEATSKNIITEIQNRVMSMSMIHDRLSKNSDNSSIATKDYITSLVNNIFNSYNNTSELIKIEVEIDDIVLDVEQAMALGLLINELLTNSLKYAFDDRTKGTIQVILQRGAPCTLEVRDNGKGIPDDFDPDQSESLGMGIIESLVIQLGGGHTFKSDGGTVFNMEFDCTNDSE